MDIYHIVSNQINNQDLLDELPSQGFIWIDSDDSEIPQTVKKIEQLTKVKIFEQHIEDCLNIQHPSFYDSTDAYDFIIFRSLITAENNKKIETTPVVFFIFNNLMVTISHHNQAITRTLKRLESTRKQIPNQPMSLAYLVIDEIIDNFLALRLHLIDEYNHLEKQLFSQNKNQVDWPKFLQFKTMIRKLRILSEDQQEVVYQWRQDNEIGLNDVLGVHFSDLLNHIHRIITYTTQLEAELDTLMQLYYSLISNKTNEVVKILTVLSAIFLPLNLVAGIFGMNFEHMNFFRVPYAVDITLIGMAALGVGLFIFFKWKKWI